MYRLVFVDDEPWALSGLTELLDWESYGFTVAASYTDPHEAYDGILRIRPDAVFTDIRMPGMSGITLIESLKQAGVTAEYALISAHADFEAAQKAITMGVCQYILKPFDEKQVAEAAARLTERFKQREELPVLDMQSDTGKQLLKNAAIHPFCYVYLSDCVSLQPLATTNSLVTHVVAHGYPDAYLISTVKPDKKHMSSLSAAWEPSQGAGCSQFYPDFTKAERMFEEAYCALVSGITYSDSKSVADIQFYMCQMIAKNLSLQEIATHFFFSETYLSGMFKKRTGETVTSFLQDIRIRRAARMLYHSDKALKAIAEEVGYHDYSYFGRLFKKRFGVSPEAFRNTLP